MRRIVTFTAFILIFALTNIQLYAQTLESDATSANNEQVALEFAEWGMPVVTFFAQKEVNVRFFSIDLQYISFLSSSGL